MEHSGERRKPKHNYLILLGLYTKPNVFVLVPIFSLDRNIYVYDTANANNQNFSRLHKIN